MNSPLNFVAYHFGYRQRSRLVGSRQQLPELFPDDVSNDLADVWNTGAKVAARRREGSESGWSVVVTGSGLQGTLDVCRLGDKIFDGCRRATNKTAEDVVPHAPHEDSNLLLFCSLRVSACAQA